MHRTINDTRRTVSIKHINGARRPKPKSKRRRRAAIEDLERVHRADFTPRAPRPLPAGRKARAPRRTDTKVAADEAAIMALRPLDGAKRERSLKVVGVPYLFVRVHPSGRRAYECLKRVKVQGTKQCTSRVLGEVGVMTLQEAKIAVQFAVAKLTIQERDARVAELEARVAELEAYARRLEAAAARDEARRRQVLGMPRGPADA